MPLMKDTIAPGTHGVPPKTDRALCSFPVTGFPIPSFVSNLLQEAVMIAWGRRLGLTPPSELKQN